MSPNAANVVAVVAVVVIVVVVVVVVVAGRRRSLKKPEGSVISFRIELKFAMMLLNNIPHRLTEFDS